MLERYLRIVSISGEWILDIGGCCYGNLLEEGGIIFKKRVFRSFEGKEIFVVFKLFNFVGKYNFRWYLKLFI